MFDMFGDREEKAVPALSRYEQAMNLKTTTFVCLLPDGELATHDEKFRNVRDLFGTCGTGRSPKVRAMMARVLVWEPILYFEGAGNEEITGLAAKAHSAGIITAREKAALFAAVAEAWGADRALVSREVTGLGQNEWVDMLSSALIEVGIAPLVPRWALDYDGDRCQRGWTVLNGTNEEF